MQVSGEWSYTPNTNFNGSDSFTVTITDDDGNAESQDINVTVSQVNDEQHLEVISQELEMKMTTITGTLTASDIADGLTNPNFTVSADGVNGSATIDASTGAWSYTPNTNFNGSDSFTVTITDDDGHTESQVINVSVSQVNDDATFGGDISGSGDEDGDNDHRNINKPVTVLMV